MVHTHTTITYQYEKTLYQLQLFELQPKIENPKNTLRLIHLVMC